MGSLFVFRRLLAAFVCLLFVSFSFPVIASIDTGITWLKSRQQVDGSFSDIGSQATQNQVTEEALLALHQSAQLDSSIAQLASEYLRANRTGFLEEIANFVRLASINPTYFPVPNSQLSEYKSASGGYGDYPGYKGSVSASAILVHALTAQNTQHSVNVNEVIAYLLAKQKSNKGWSEESSLSSVYVTALVSRALQAHRLTFNLSTSILSATDYLLANQKDGGGWSGNLETAIALLAVVPAVADPSRYEKAVDRLTAAQSANGSWNNDVYTTALALQVLHLVKSTPVVETPTTGSVSGSVMRAATNLPLAAVQVQISGASNLTLTTDEAGHFATLNLNPGSYTLTYSAVGFAQTEQAIQINTGDRVDLGAIKLNVLPTHALIRGQVTDLSTGLPLSGVVIQFSGSQNAQVSTDQNGFYALELSPGQVSLSVALNGYHSVSGSLEAIAGTYFDFSPSLQTLDTAPATEITLKGIIIDAQSELPLSGAKIRVVSTALSSLSDENGAVNLSGLSEGAISVEISLAGYQTITFAGSAVANSIINLGLVRLSPVLVDRLTLYGRVLDANTGAAISGAAITVDSQSATSDAVGNYELSNILAKTFSLSASADGYQAANSQISATEYGRMKLDILLTKIQTSNVVFKRIALEKTAYGAYEEAKLQGVIHNQGASVEEVLIQAQVINPGGVIIEEFTVSQSMAAASPLFELNPNAEIDFTASWFTKSLAPGQYTLTATAYANSTSQLLAQQQVVVDVVPTTTIASLKVGAKIEHVNQGSTHDVGFTASVRNQSNIPVSLRISYDLSDPSGNVVYTDDAIAEMAPSQIFATVDIGTHSQQFSNSGAYKMRVLSIDSVQPTLIETGSINVIPDISINVEQSITPAATVPRESERVRVKIRLEGAEVN